MKSSSEWMSQKKVSTVGNALLIATLCCLGGAGCNQGGEGDRCNPALIDPTTGSNHDECGSGLTCQQPATCAENYCCPSDPTKSSNPFCNGTGCPAPATPAAEASTDSGTEDDGSMEDGTSP